MKRELMIAALSGMLVCGVINTHAATTAKTNWVEAVTLTATAWENGEARPAALTTKSLLAALGSTVAGAKLLFVQNAAGSTFVVREGKNDSDVTSHFSRTNGPLRATVTANGTTTRRSVDVLHFDGTNLTFDLTAFEVETGGPVGTAGPTVTKTFTASGSGEGIVGTSTTNNAVITGTFKLGAGHLE